MNVTSNVIDDLLPAYFSGEASADTRALVEQHFREHPAYEVQARRVAKTLQDALETVAVEPRLERTALRRAKRRLRMQTALFAVASTLTLNAISLQFSLTVDAGHVHVHWLSLPGQTTIIGALLLLAAVVWVFYFRTRRSVRRRVLG
jgi:anti-sigma factor RsiW